MKRMQSAATLDRYGALCLQILQPFSYSHCVPCWLLLHECCAVSNKCCFRPRQDHYFLFWFFSALVLGGICV
jgi:hypothetical protein